MDCRWILNELQELWYNICCYYDNYRNPPCPECGIKKSN